MGEKLCVIGLGYVGLPLSCVLASSGYQVIGVDTNKDTVEGVNRGKTTIIEKGLDELLSKAVSSKSLVASTDYSSAKKCTRFIICTPTPVSEDGKPNLKYLFSACESLSKVLKGGDLIIVESSVPPGTMEKVLEIIEKKSGLKAGKDVFLAHCPERIFPVDVINEIINNDRVVAGFDNRSLEMALKVYKSFSNGNLLTTDIRTAELVKLVENVYRDVNIALSNELALICEALKVDVKEIIRLANSHPRVNLMNPGCGVGGSCIPKDPVLLINICREHGIDPILIKVSREINENMPRTFVERIVGKMGKGVGKTALVLGLAYKGNVCDTRDSPAINAIKEMERNGFKTVAYDPFVKHVDGVKTIDSLDVKEKFDVMVLCTDHDEFKSLGENDFRRLLNTGGVVADGRRIFDKNAIERLGFKYIGIGI